MYVFMYACLNVGMHAHKYLHVHVFKKVHMYVNSELFYSEM